MTERDVDVRLRLLNAKGFIRDMKLGAAQIRAAGAEGVTASARLIAAGKGLRTIGGTMTKHLTLPIVAGGIALAKYSMDFKQQMTLIQTQAGASGKEVARMTPVVMRLSKQFGIAPTEIAKALFHIESVGLRGPRAIDALTASVKGSVVGLADLESVSTTLAGTWLAKIGGSGRQFNDIMAELNATVGAGNIRMNDLVNAIGTGILPVAKEAHLRIRDVTGALAVMTDEGMPANMAMRLLRTSLNFVVAPTTKASNALQKLGMSPKAMARDIRKPQGLLRALTDLHDHLNKLPGGSRGIDAGMILRDLFPAGRGVPLHILLNQLDRYSMKMGQLDKIHSRFGKSVKQQMQTPAQRWKVMMNNLRIAALQWGDAFLPIVMKLGAAVAWVSGKFSKLSKPMKSIVVTVLALAAAIGPVTWAIGVMAGGFGRLLIAGQKLSTGLVWLAGKYRFLTRDIVAQGAAQKRNDLGQLMPIGPGTRFARLLQSNTRWTFTKFGVWAGAAAAAALAGWEIGKWLRVNVPAVKTAGDFLGNKFGKAFWDMWDRHRPSLSDLTPRLGGGIGLGGSFRSQKKKRHGGVSGFFHDLGNELLGKRGWGGTVSRQGDYLVGERGPERISLPPGARVQPLTPSLAQAFASERGGGADEAHYHLYVDGKEITTAVTRVEKRKAARK